MTRPDAAIASVARIACRVEPFDWPFAAGEAERLDSHWRTLVARKPTLFDGRVLMSRRIAVDPTDGGTLRGTAFEVGFKAFIGWRDFGFPDQEVHNLFAMPALLSSDGAFMLGRMSATTANAGRLYFPAGTPEPSDAGADGFVDFDANILRELEEETGLTATEVDLGAGWTVVLDGPVVACMKVARSTLTADALARRVADFIGTQARPELDGLVAVRREADFDHADMPPFMLRYMAVVFAEGQAR